MPGIRPNQFEASLRASDVRLDLNSTTSLKLWGLDATSKSIDVGGIAVDCTTPKIINKSDNLITSAGADAAVNMSNSTLYYVYVSNTQASYAPLSVRASATAPTSGYLGTSGNAANWRYVGDCYPWSDGLFKDGYYDRLVRSEYNIIWRGLGAWNATGSWSYATATWRELNGGTGQTRGYFLGDGKSHINVIVNVLGNVSGSTYLGGLGYDSVVSSYTGTPSYSSGSGLFQSTGNALLAPTKGLHYITELEYGTATAYGYPDSSLNTLVPV